MSLSPELRTRREALIREHFESENRKDFHATLGAKAESQRP